MIRLIACGKVKEKWMRDGIEEYAKRIQPYEKLEIVEVKDEKTLDNMENVIQFAVKNRCQLKVLPYINKSVKKFVDVKSFIAKKLQKYTYSFEHDDVCGINWWFLPNGARIKLISTPCMDNNIGLCKEYAELRLLPDMRLQRCIFDEPVIIKNIDSFTREINMLWNKFYHCPLGRIT